MAEEPTLPSWTSAPARNAIEAFVTKVTKAGSPDFVPPEERVAVFDNDGTLWCEKPMPVELGFILGRMAEQAAQDPSLREKQPWKAAAEKDYKWFGEVITRHYQGDDTDVKVLLGGVLRAFAGMTVDEYQAEASGYFDKVPHPTLGRPFTRCSYAPMVELLRYLEVNGFTNFIVSGGSRDFMRVITAGTYGIPAERVVGSSNGLEWAPDGNGGGNVAYIAKPDVFDDGPAKPVRLWSRIGRRPIIAGGNSNGDVPMLQFAGGTRPALRLLVLHDDKDREFDYVAGAEKSLELAKAGGWTVVSMKHDWSRVFD